VNAGATEVIAAELEASVTMTRLVLDRCRVATEEIAPYEERIRERREDEFDRE
jgi:hypothetical protein